MMYYSILELIDRPFHTSLICQQSSDKSFPPLRNAIFITDDIVGI